MASKFIHASTLFTPAELEEYTRYLYIHKTLPRQDRIPLPTAAAFSAFQTWRRTRSLSPTPPANSPTYPGFVTAAACGHPLHPGHIAALAAQDDLTTPIQYCSVCALRLHRDLVAALWKRVRAVGGPWRGLPVDVPQATYLAVKAAFGRARTALVNDIDVLEDTAQLEREWEAENPGRSVSVARAWGAVEAMRRYRDNATFATHGKGEGVRTPAPEKNEKKKKKREVGFAEDTPEETSHRPQATWCRLTAEYTDEGPYACPSDEGWLDTSFLRDWTYAVRQSRILLVFEDPALNVSRYKYRDLNVGPDRGENEIVQRLIYMINRWLRAQRIPLQDQWVQYLAKSGDAFLVCASDECTTELFDTWELRETLEGSAVEEYAKEVGDLEAEEGSEATTGERSSETRPGEGEGWEDASEEDNMSLTSDNGDSDEGDKDEDIKVMEDVEDDGMEGNDGLEDACEE
jgi:hypothetical protein